MNCLDEADRVYIWNQQWVASIIYTEAERRMIISMKHVLLMVAVVLGLCLPAAGAGRPENEERPAMIVEKAIRKQLKKPKGELAKVDLEKVVSLNLNFTKITDEGLKELPKLKQLTYLRLFSTQITDSSLNELAKRQQLTAIDLGSTQITDAGLKELAKLKQLTSLNLNNTKVMKAGVAELRKALPKCEISH